MWGWLVLVATLVISALLYLRQSAAERALRRRLDALRRDAGGGL